jgi:hypothetical protein
MARQPIEALGWMTTFIIYVARDDKADKGQAERTG